MNKKTLNFMFVIVLTFLSFYSCVSNNDDQKKTDNPTTANVDSILPGKWEGKIDRISYQSVKFNGARITMSFSEGDSSFSIIARDTTGIFSPAIKDTILLLDGKWQLDAKQDSIILKCSHCRALDTSTNTLNERSVGNQLIPLPLNIIGSGSSIVWRISFLNLSPLIPLLGLEIAESDKSLLALFNIDFAKKD